MTPPRVEKAFTHVLAALAELEALSSIDALPGASACAARLELRLRRYLAVSGRVADQPHLTAEVMGALMARVNEAIGRGAATGVISAGSDLRDEVVAHHRALDPGIFRREPLKVTRLAKARGRAAAARAPPGTAGAPRAGSTPAPPRR